MENQISNLFLSMHKKVQEVMLNLMNETDHISDFSWIGIVTTIFIILRWIGHFLKRKFLDTLQIHQKSLLLEINIMKKDTIKLATILRDTNEKLSDIIIRNECERKLIYDDPDPLMRNIANRVRILIKQTVNEAYVTKSTPNDTNKKCKILPQNNNAATQTDTCFTNYIISPTKKNLNIDSDTIKYKCIKDKISKLHENIQRETKYTTYPPLFQRLQRIWIGGKWYIEGLNEFKEAYAFSKFMSKFDTNETGISSNEASACNVGLDGAKPRDIRETTSSPFPTGNTLTFSEFIEQMQRTKEIPFSKSVELISQKEKRVPNFRKSSSATLESSLGTNSNSSTFNEQHSQADFTNYPASNSSNTFINIEESALAQRDSRIDLCANTEFSLFKGASENPLKTKSRSLPLITTKPKSCKYILRSPRTSPGNRVVNIEDDNNTPICFKSRLQEAKHIRYRKSILKRVQSSPENKIKHVSIQL